MAEVFYAIANRIDTVELFFIKAIPVSSPSSPQHSYHGQLCFSSTGRQGWGEICIPAGTTECNTSIYEQQLAFFKGITIAKAFEQIFARRGLMLNSILEAAEAALIDLCGRLYCLPALELLQLTGRHPVPGLVCIQADTPEKAAYLAGQTRQKKLKTHLKIKLSDNAERDTNIIRAVRQAMGSDVYIIGSAGQQYGRELKPLSGTLSRAMRLLKIAGLNACEDPAKLTWPDWNKLQKQFDDMDFIAEEPLRTAWKAIPALEPVRGQFYTIRPGVAGSIITAVELGIKITNAGGRLTVGDAGLAGTGCSMWQQLAIGLGAAWVESLEKPDRCHAITDCRSNCATRQNPEGKYGIAISCAGFGTDIDRTKLKSLSSHYSSL